MLCPSCGSPISDGSKFCPVCGATVGAPSGPAAPGPSASGQYPQAGAPGAPGSAVPGAAPGGPAQGVPTPGSTSRYPALGGTPGQPGMPAQPGMPGQTGMPSRSGMPGQPGGPAQSGPVEGGTPFAMPSSGALNSGAAGMPRNTAANAFNAGAAAYDAAGAARGAGIPAGPGPAPRPSDAEKEARKQRRREGKARVKAARAALRTAKRDADISPVPKILLTALLVVLLVLGGGAGSWALFAAPQDDRIADLQQQIDDKDAELEKLKQTAATAASTAAEPETTAATTGAATTSAPATTGAAAALGDYSALIGTWNGALDKTEVSNSGSGRCYAGQSQPLTLNIKSIDPNGRMKLDVNVLYHNHNETPKSDVDTTAGDSYESYTDVTSTLEADGSFNLKITKGDNNDGTITIKCTFDKVGGQVQQRMTAVVVSDPVAWASNETDTYTMTKA